MVPEEVGVVDGVYKGLTSAHAQKKVYSHSEGNAKCLNLSEGEIVFIK